MTAIRGLRLKCDVDTVPHPKILVVSHERSGTHFLMNSLALNFGYISTPWLNVDFELGLNLYSSSCFESLFASFLGHSIRNVIKSHHEFGFYRDWLRAYHEEFRVICIVRDVRNVMKSYYRFLLNLDWLEGPKCNTLSEFVRATPIGAMTRFQRAAASNMIERWKLHLDSWIEGGQELGQKMFRFVQYERLDSDFDTTIAEISEFLNRPMPNEVIRPDRFTNVVLPLPKLELQQFQFSSTDCQFIQDIAADSESWMRSHFSQRNRSVNMCGNLLKSDVPKVG